MSDDPIKYRVYYFDVAHNGQLVRKDEGFPIAEGEYMMMRTKDFSDLMYDLRWKQEPTTQETANG